jgi:hypothetical protein
MQDNIPYTPTPMGVPFKVRGQAVVILNQDNIMVSINCPFMPSSTGPNPDESAYIMQQTQSVVNYMLSEKIVDINKKTVKIAVTTTHPKLH